MPRPTESGARYVPGLDGVRALAVASVIVYHLGVPGGQGGMLGVGVFFTLSGYLITDLLFSGWQRNGSLGLKEFWRQRARRLLPALFLMLAVVSVWVAVLDAGQLADVRRQVLAAIIYMSNWSTIAQHGSYFARFAAPLPLDHLWSLAIEEQFYLVWPWLLLLAIWTARSRSGAALLTLAGAAASVALMALLYHPGYDPTRVYEGTDTRASALLIGAALAILWPRQVAGGRPRRAVRDVLDGLGVAGLIAIVLLVVWTNPFSQFLYPYGFLLLTLATAAIVAAVVNAGSRLGVVLGWGPLRWIGVRSYGIYLWQWPIIVLTNRSQSGFEWSRAALQVGATVAVAALSWRYVENPIRHGALGRLWRRLGAEADRVRPSPRVLVVSGTVLAGLVVPAVSLSGLLPVPSAGRGPVEAAGPLLQHTQSIIGRAPAAPRVTHVRPVHDVLPPAPPTKTSCRSVVYIGDSTSEGEISDDYIPNPAQRLGAQLADVGVHTTIPEISPGRSIVETLDGQPNAATVAQQELGAGFHGCWILALGINDAADVQVGSHVGMSERIARMMSIIGRQPVLWVAAVTLVRSGPYAEPGMQQWNQDLLAACRRYPNMRVFNWPAYAKPQWFIPDGIHYYSPGYVARAHLISKGLVHAFPKGEPASASCVVR